MNPKRLETARAEPKGANVASFGCWRRHRCLGTTPAGPGGLRPRALLCAWLSQVYETLQEWASPGGPVGRCQLPPPGPLCPAAGAAGGAVVHHLPAPLLRNRLSKSVGHGVDETPCEFQPVRPLVGKGNRVKGASLDCQSIYTSDLTMRVLCCASSALWSSPEKG
jgi:hypothetical protein